MAPELKQIAWPNKFKPRSIDKYDGSSNPEDFLQVYTKSLRPLEVMIE
jgi:hypothetical protein